MAGHSSRAQSAMEYLMTYGWAILVIAVVLGALFLLGVFNGSNLTSSACSASPGYLCGNPVYLHSTGNILVTVGQSTGTAWTSAAFVFVPPGTPYVNGLPNVSFTSPPANTILITQGLISGGQEGIYLPASGGNVSIGTVITGSIWARYNYTIQEAGVAHTAGPYYAQVAALNLKAS